MATVLLPLVTFLLCITLAGTGTSDAWVWTVMGFAGLIGLGLVIDLLAEINKKLSKSR